MPFRKRYKVVSLVALGLLAALGIALAQFWSQPFGAKPDATSLPISPPAANATYQPHFTLSSTLKTYRLEAENAGFVSIAPLSDSSFFACDYLGISLVTEEQTAEGDKSYAIKRLEEPEGIDLWNPTGLFFKADTRSLYVANYNGHNLLKLAYDPQQQTLALQQEITDPQMISPENIHVLPSGEIFAADYDGSAIFKFAPDGKRLWKQEVGQAHGLAVVGETIYATSTFDRSVVKLNSDGEILKTAGQIGTNIGDYVWPVAITSLQNGQLAVTDAQAGRITLINDQLEVIEAIGANGPGVDLLNYPYTLVQLATGELLLTDTYKWRTLKLTEDWTVTEQLLSKVDVAGRQFTPVFPADNKPYTYPSFPGVNIHSKIGIDTFYSAKAMGGFNSIDYDADATLATIGTSASSSEQNDQSSSASSGFTKQLELNTPHSAYVFNTGYWYTLWSKVVSVTEWGDVIVASSPQSIYVVVIDPLTGSWSRADISLSTFPYEDEVISPNGETVDLVQLVGPAVEQFKQLKTLLNSGSTRVEAYQQVFADDIEEFVSDSEQSVWAAIFSSTEEGKDFYTRYSQNPEQVQRLAAEYFTKTLPQFDNNLFELLAVNYLAGGQDFQLRQIDTELRADSSLKFYSDHGLENAIAQDAQAKPYVSADKDQFPYRFTLNIPKSIKTRSLVVKTDWLDISNYPTQYSLNCFDADQKLLATTQVKNNTEVVNIASFTTEQPIASVEYDISQFKGEQRLLLRNIDMFTVPQGQS